MELPMREDKFALLIDADNISQKHIGKIISEASKHGKSTIRRAYGDWTSPALASWKSGLLDNAITPMVQCSNVSGKNSTDSAMIIDAMDILYSGNVNGFCLVSSDSDFTKLATRIRESGLIVIGIGEEKTPSPFRRACDRFITINTDSQEKTEEQKENKTTTSKETEKPKKENKNVNIPLEIKKAVKDFLSGSDENVHITAIKTYLLRLKPDFNEKDYGYSKFSKFIEAIDGISIIDGKDGGAQLAILKQKTSKTKK